jgi:predicted enzyme related to lactoylglutathione lyase
MSNAEIRGRFIWHELMTTDPEAAAAFYSKVVPWKAQPSPVPSYSLWMAGKASAGGLMALPEEDSARSPHWLVYIGTPDVDATVQEAQKRGAKVLKAAVDLAGVGRYAVLSDPQGAQFAVFTPEGTAPGDGEGTGGQFSWHELATTEPDGATDFYVELFGWERGPSHDLGEMGTYQLIEHAGAQIGGIHRVRPGMAPRWLCYVQVVDADQAAEAARAAGGRVVNGPVEVPDGSWIVMLQDPQGGAFAVHEPVVKAKPARKAARPAKPRPVEAATRAAAAEQPKPAMTSEAVLTPPPPSPVKPPRKVVPLSEARKAPEAAPAPARKSPSKKAAVRKVPGKKAAPAKAAARKTVAKPKPARAVAKPAPRKKAAVRHATAKRAKGSAVRGSTRRAVAKKAAKGRKR